MYKPLMLTLAMASIALPTMITFQAQAGELEDAVQKQREKLKQSGESEVFESHGTVEAEKNMITFKNDSFEIDSLKKYNLQKRSQLMGWETVQVWGRIILANPRSYTKHKFDGEVQN